jgi:DNA processing protein
VGAFSPAGGAANLSDLRKYWVGFNLVKGIGAARLRRLIDYFGSVEAAWIAPSQSLLAAGLNQKLVENFLLLRSDVSLDRVWERLQESGIKVLTWEDQAYPKRLIEIDQPPPVLYLRGDLLPEDDWAVAVVGTRRITGYGRQVAEEISSFLANNGITVISGLARGVDSVAHKSALDAGGRSLAVLGNGVDQIYPPEHRRLADAIVQHGALISDYPPGTPPDSVNFPPRNRIISGLSQAVVIVEAGERSGALITANFAAEQGRDVFAVPGNINAPQSKGTNRLIQQGANPLLDAQEILEMLNLTQIVEHRAARAALPVDPTEARLLGVIGHEPRHIDDICRQSDLPIDQVSATLALMELKGIVRQVGGMNYVAVREMQEDYQVGEGI